MVKYDIIFLSYQFKHLFPEDQCTVDDVRDNIDNVIWCQIAS